MVYTFFIDDTTWAIIGRDLGGVKGVEVYVSRWSGTVGNPRPGVQSLLRRCGGGAPTETHRAHRKLFFSATSAVEFSAPPKLFANNTRSSTKPTLPPFDHGAFRPCSWLTDPGVTRDCGIGSEFTGRPKRSPAQARNLEYSPRDYLRRTTG